LTRSTIFEQNINALEGNYKLSKGKNEKYYNVKNSLNIFFKVINEYLAAAIIFIAINMNSTIIINIANFSVLAI
jgi:hypothetical protein